MLRSSPIILNFLSKRKHVREGFQSRREDEAANSDLEEGQKGIKNLQKR